MTVRRATAADIPDLVRMAQAEHALSRFAAQPFEAERVALHFDGAIHGMASVVFVSAGGFIGGMVQPNLMNRYSTAYELAWYAEDGTGMRLLRAFVAWARRMRAVEVIVHNYAAIKSTERFGRVMQRTGFAQFGTSYTLNLEN